MTRANRIKLIVFRGSEFHAGGNAANKIRGSTGSRFLLEEADGTRWIVDPRAQRYGPARSGFISLAEIESAVLDRKDEGMDAQEVWT